MSNDLIVQVVGWLSSLILVPSLAYQTYKQWHEDTSEGVSVALYLGSLISNIGFAVYSWLQGDWVFIVSNTLLAINSSIGLCILYKHRFRKGKLR